MPTNGHAPEFEYSMIMIAGETLIPLSASGEQVGDLIAPGLAKISQQLNKVSAGWEVVSHSLTVVSGHPIATFLLRRPK